MRQYDLGAGVFPDVAIYQGKIYVAWQRGSTLNVKTLDGSVDWPIRLAPGTLAFPRLGVIKDKLFLVWRNGGDDFAKAQYAEVGNLASLVELGVSPGNDPVAIGQGRIAYQALDPQRVLTVIPEEVSVTRARETIRPTGLSRILPNGLVTFVDEDRLAVGGVTRPSWAGLIVAGEGPTGGAVLPTLGGASFWHPLDCFTPRLANGGFGNAAYALATWGSTVRVVEFDATEITAGMRYFAIAPPVPPVIFDPPPAPPEVHTMQAPNLRSLIERVIAEHPEIDTLDEHERGKILDYACAEAGLPWGRKSRNAQGTDLNTDAFCFLRADGLFEIYDVISGTNGRATWDPSGPFRPGENGFWVKAQPVGPVVVQPPAPPVPPTPGVDIFGLLRRVAALEAKAAQPTRIAFRTANGHLLCAEGGGGGEVNATREHVGEWETFTVEPV